LLEQSFTACMGRRMNSMECDCASFTFWVLEV